MSIELNQCQNKLFTHFFISRRKFWPGFSSYTCWQTLLASTKRASKDHQILADIYNGQMLTRFTELMDDMQRIYKEVSKNNINNSFQSP